MAYFTGFFRVTDTCGCLHTYHGELRRTPQSCRCEFGNFSKRLAHPRRAPTGPRCSRARERTRDISSGRPLRRSCRDFPRQGPPWARATRVVDARGPNIGLTGRGCPAQVFSRLVMKGADFRNFWICNILNMWFISLNVLVKYKYNGKP